MTKNFSAREAGIVVLAAATSKIDALSADLARLQKAEAEGLRLQDLRKTEARRTIFKTLAKAESMPAEKSISASGSGGSLVKAAGDPSKPPAVPMAKPPASPKVAAAGAAPALPKPAKPLAAPGLAKCDKGVFGKLKANKGAF